MTSDDLPHQVLMYEGSRAETGARADSTLEKLSSLKPVMTTDEHR